MAAMEALRLLREEKQRRHLDRVRQDIDQVRANCMTFRGFAREAWPIIEPHTPLRWNWHLDCIADHLEAISREQLRPRIIFNVPPGCSKSTLVSVLHQAFEWGPLDKPGLKFLSTSYELGNVKRDTRKTRDLIMSEWYRLLWPEVVLTRTGELSFQNTKTGTREGVAFSSLTAKRGDRLTVDDPHSLLGAESEVEREKAVRTFLEGGINRLNDQVKSAIIIVMQRLHEADLTGALLARDVGYEHVMLPMEFEPERRCVTSIGFQDPRSYDGELLDQNRFPREAVDELKKENEFMYAGQYQQRPAPREGGMFKVERITGEQNELIVSHVPLGARRVRGWDIAGSTRKKSPFTVGVRLAYLDPIVYVEDVVRERAEIEVAEKLIEQTCEEDGVQVRQSLPQDPGSAGKPVWIGHNILMEDGSRKRLGDVLVGDAVIGIDGKPHAVTEVFEQGDLPTLEIVTASGRTLYTAPDHPILTTEGWMEAGELNLGSFLGLKAGPETLPTCQRSIEEFRLAGYFIGDGSVGRATANGPTSSCDAGFTCADPETLADFKLCVGSLGGEVVQRYRAVCYGAKGMQTWLRETNIAGHTSYTKRVPDWVFAGSPEKIAAFVGAYMATDGTIDVTGREAVFYSVSRELLMDVQQLLMRLGIHATIKTKNGKYLETRHVSHLLRLAQREDAVGIFARTVPIYHSTKAQRLREWSGASMTARFPAQWIADKVVRIEDGGARSCRCLAVADAHSFVVEDVVVHNSQKRHMAVNLAGLDFTITPETGDKTDRAIPFASMCNAGNVRLVKGPWNKAYIEELRNFPGSTYKDQVDASSRAFAEMAPFMRKKRRIPVGVQIVGQEQG